MATAPLPNDARRRGHQAPPTEVKPPNAQEGQAGAYPLQVICELFDITPRRVQQLARDGIIPRAQHGLYNLVGSIKGYIRFLKGNADAATNDTDGERRRWLAVRREEAELRMQAARGQSIDRAAAERQVAELARQERDSWLSWPTRVSATIAAETGADEELLHAALEREVRDHLRGLTEPHLRPDVPRVAAG